MAGLGITSCPLRGQVDPRALRFTAAATAAVLAVVLLTIDAVRPLALGLLASQVAMYGFTAFVSMHWSVWAQLFARVIWPRIGPVTALEDARPARFAQFIGFVLTAVALVALIVDVDVVGYAMTALAGVGAVIRATTGWCPGCQIYVLVRRLQHRADHSPAPPVPGASPSTIPAQTARWGGDRPLPLDPTVTARPPARPTARRRPRRRG
ncbi:DUF4395 domain-containing protein [Georgenia sp. H159]|uniref:DUF4395 domain-containing protein n=1 Tax=Georgenia sp. H159 TaxID=3076115 RepID=UPI002D77447D|nr:DUF4395 domain-containing protein [Georgenia sp. H159]